MPLTRHAEEFSDILSESIHAGRWFRAMTVFLSLVTLIGASPGITGLGHRASWQSCIDHCPKSPSAHPS